MLQTRHDVSRVRPAEYLDHQVEMAPEETGLRRKGFPVLPLVAALAVIVLGALVWYVAHRPAQSEWNSAAITARFADLKVVQGHKNVHLLLHYDLINNTPKPWRMPPPNLGTLMRRLPNGNLHEVDSAQWEQVAIPAGKTGEVSFDLLIDPSKTDLPPEELRDPQELDAFVNRHLRRIQGLVFRDYSTHDSIDLARGWDSQAPPQQTSP